METLHSLVSIRNYIALKHTANELLGLVSLVSIRNYIALKQYYAYCEECKGLVSIRNYIALKLEPYKPFDLTSLVSIRNYIALKPQIEAQASGSLFPAIPHGSSSKNLVRKIFVDNYLFLGIQLLLSVCALHHDQTYAMAQRIAIYGLER